MAKDQGHVAQHRWPQSPHTADPEAKCALLSGRQRHTGVFPVGVGPAPGQQAQQGSVRPEQAGGGQQPGWVALRSGRGMPPSPRPLPRGPPKGARPFLGSRSLSKQGRRGGWGRRPWGDLEAAGLGLMTPGALRGWEGGVPIGLLTPTSAEAGVPVRSPPSLPDTEFQGADDGSAVARVGR